MPGFTSFHKLAFLLFHMWSRYIPVAVYTFAQLKRKSFFAGLTRRIRERSVAAAQWSLQRLKSNRGSCNTKMKQPLVGAVKQPFIEQRQPSAELTLKYVFKAAE